jgi:purine nucleoside phosphorylase
MSNQTEVPAGDLLLLLAVVLPPVALDHLGEVVDERTLSTPFGGVGPLALRQMSSGERIWVQPYSGLPSRTDPRATLLAAKKLGVQRVLNWDAGIGINPMLSRGQAMIAVDYIDFTRHQPTTFFTQEGVPALPQDPPICPQMTNALFDALAPLMPIPAGVYVGVDGPRRETAAEARMFRAWGGDVLGQNLVPEISLAGELGLCYAGLITVEHLSADQAPLPSRGELRQGLGLVLAGLADFVRGLGREVECTCGSRAGQQERSSLLVSDWQAGS